jgi:hypothetical protein
MPRIFFFIIIIIIALALSFLSNVIAFVIIYFIFYIFILSRKWINILFTFLISRWTRFHLFFFCTLHLTPSTLQIPTTNLISFILFHYTDFFSSFVLLHSRWLFCCFTFFPHLRVDKSLKLMEEKNCFYCVYCHFFFCCVHLLRTLSLNF